MVATSELSRWGGKRCAAQIVTNYFCTKSLAAEFAARGVRINAVCPGHVDTPMGNKAPPEGDIDWQLVMRAAPKLKDGSCDAEDVARAVAYLASEDARKITGTTLVIDGGQLAA